LPERANDPAAVSGTACGRGEGDGAIPNEVTGHVHVTSSARRPDPRWPPAHLGNRTQFEILGFKVLADLHDSRRIWASKLGFTFFPLRDGRSEAASKVESIPLADLHVDVLTLH
jgi:hypothetical protein